MSPDRKPFNQKKEIRGLAKIIKGFHPYSNLLVPAFRELDSKHGKESVESKAALLVPHITFMAFDFFRRAYKTGVWEHLRDGVKKKLTEEDIRNPNTNLKSALEVKLPERITLYHNSSTYDDLRYLSYVPSVKVHADGNVIGVIQNLFFTYDYKEKRYHPNMVITKIGKLARIGKDSLIMQDKYYEMADILEDEYGERPGLLLVLIPEIYLGMKKKSLKDLIDNEKVAVCCFSQKRWQIYSLVRYLEDQVKNS